MMIKSTMYIPLPDGCSIEQELAIRTLARQVLRDAAEQIEAVARDWQVPLVVTANMTERESV